MSVAVFGSIRFRPEDIPPLMPSLKALVETTRLKDGGFSYDVAQDVSEPGLLRFSGSWPDVESLDAHLNSVHVADWRRAIAAFAPRPRLHTLPRSTSRDHLSAKPGSSPGAFTPKRSRPRLGAAWRAHDFAYFAAGLDFTPPAFDLAPGKQG